MILKNKNLLILIYVFFVSNCVVANTPPVNNNSKYENYINNLAQLAGYGYININLSPSERVKNNGAMAICSDYNTVLYYPSFLENVYQNGFGFSETSINNNETSHNSKRLLNWQQSGVLAHELGHIVFMHCDKYLKNGQRKQAEIEADVFMGKVLHLLGATLEQAQSCLYLPIVNEEETDNYPSRTGRLNNVKKGWNSYIPNNKINIERELVKARLLFLKDKVVDAFNIYKKYENNTFLNEQDLYSLGFCYYFGYGTYPNTDKAKKYFLECYTNYKSINAATQLSSIEFDDKNYYKAIEYGEYILNNVENDNFELKTEKGIREMYFVASTEHNLADAYTMIGDKQKALKLYKRSADKQFSLAYFSLSALYFQEGNKKLSLFWVNQFLLQVFDAQSIVNLGGEAKAYEIINTAKQIKKQLTDEIKKQ